MPRSIDRAALDRMTMMTMMMTRGDDGDDDPSPQIHIISHKVRHGPTRNMMESYIVRHRPTTAHATCIFFLYRKRFLRIREVCKHFTCNVAAKHTAAPISLSSA